MNRALRRFLPAILGAALATGCVSESRTGYALKGVGGVGLTVVGLAASGEGDENTAILPVIAVMGGIFLMLHSALGLFGPDWPN